MGNRKSITLQRRTSFVYMLKNRSILAEETMNLGESNKKIWNHNPQLLLRQNHILESITEHSHTPLSPKTKKEEKFTYL